VLEDRVLRTNGIDDHGLNYDRGHWLTPDRARRALLASGPPVVLARTPQWVRDRRCRWSV